jgi:ABC-type transport system involved in multi-copper enzyme maturation permease subunit
MTTSVLTGFEATTALARLSFKRVLRGKAVWFAFGLGLLPNVLTLVMRIHGSDAKHGWNGIIGTFLVLMAIIPPILIASSLSDEIDDKTSAYLWSRAVPRWSVVTGKLLGLVPVAALSMIVGLFVAWMILGAGPALGGIALERAVIGFTAGTIGASAISAMIATIAPRFAVPIAVCWLLLLDATVGSVDMNLHVITISFGARNIAYGDGGLAGPVSLAILTVLSLAIAIRRVSRLE